MSLPQKKRGFRKIIVDGKEFSWRFNSHIEVSPASCQANKLWIDFSWSSPFLYMNDHVVPQDSDPKIVTPSFIGRAIEFALQHDWDVMRKTGIIKIKYRDNQFTLVK